LSKIESKKRAELVSKQTEKKYGKEKQSNFEIEAARVFSPLEPLIVHVGHCQCKQDLVTCFFNYQHANDELNYK